MRYPQVFVFFNKPTAIDHEAMHTTIGRNLVVHYGPVSRPDFSAINLRARVCFEILQIKKRDYIKNYSYIAINTVQLNTLFMLKYSDDIEGVLWVESATEFKKIKTRLKALKDYWRSIGKLESSIRSYNRIEEILGSHSPHFTYDQKFIQALENHKNILKDRKISKAIFDQLHVIGRINKFKL